MSTQSTTNNESRIQRARELGLPTSVEDATPLLADASVIRAALMDVIDGYDWELYGDPENRVSYDAAYANEQRGRFADCVEKRIRELQSPPLNLGINLANFCDRHKRLRLPQPTTSSCPDCASELEKRRINDPD